MPTKVFNKARDISLLRDLIHGELFIKCSDDEDTGGMLLSGKGFVAMSSGDEVTRIELASVEYNLL